MIPKLLTPARSLDLAYRRQKPTREQLTNFESGRATLLSNVRHAVEQNETEEYVKNLVVRFLASTQFGSYDVNVRQKRDLVIRTGARPQDPVGVILEFKRPQSAAEMVTPANLNRRAFHELLYYYLQDRDKRTDADSKSLKRLVITNGYEWFLFDALDFDRLFWANTGLKSKFREFERGAASSKKNSFFYDDIAAPFLTELDAELPFTYFDLAAPAPERDQILLLKLLSPAHLLKEPFAQDANTLNRAFYEELLYLIGLEEIKDKGRKLIQRCAPERRQPGSLLENTQLILDSEHELTNLSLAEVAAYGSTYDERLQGVALELCLTWVNRLLFLKLLEGQLRRYHPGHDSRFRFLTPELIPEYDTLNKLFFRVLNTPAAERKEPVKTQYAHIPYLNSSLYEPTLLENKTSKVSALEDHLPLPLLRKSVLRSAGPPPDALAYLLRFLDAYDFASEGEEQVQEDGKALISAAVLGLIFEKLNGYKDGSFYTPGFITMYICRQTLRRAVVQHFNKAYDFSVNTIEELADTLDGKQRPAYSEHFNQLTVCDPAVGSGHFLVSALNELLAIKSELSLLLDDAGRRLRYSLVVARDELVVKDEDDRLVQYRATLAPDGTRTVPIEHTRLQSALFREKRHLMEHALFGVDLNPNSVRICRLRLWIELLKHAYYRPDTQFQELETLPNLDLNIKPGNSLLSRFPLDADLSDVFKQGKFSLKTYRAAVHEYFGSRRREAKEELQGYLQQIKQQFTVVLHKKDKRREELRLARGQYAALDTQHFLIPETLKQREAREFEMRRLELLAEQREKEIAAYEQGALFREAFEWRFEFPEVLNDQGEFRGFDVVVGNPPYGAVEGDFKAHLNKHYSVVQGRPDLYEVFVEKAYNLLSSNGKIGYIIPAPVLTNLYGAKLRQLMLSKMSVNEIVTFKYDVFDQPTVHTCILLLEKTIDEENLVNLRNGLTNPDALNDEKGDYTVPQNRLASGLAFTINVFSGEGGTADLINTMQQQELTLGKVCYLRQCIKTGNDGEYVQAFDKNPGEPWKPTLRGRTIERYSVAKSNLYLNYGPWLARNWNNKSFYETEKIIVRETGSRLTATLDFDHHYILSSLYAIYLKDSPIKFSIKFILGVLNSNLANFYIKKTALELTEGAFTKFRTNQLAQLPIPNATPTQQAEIVTLVEQVLAAKAADPTADTTASEQQIDTLVVALYGLTPTEITLI